MGTVFSGLWPRSNFTTNTEKAIWVQAELSNSHAAVGAAHTPNALHHGSIGSQFPRTVGLTA